MKTFSTMLALVLLAGPAFAGNVFIRNHCHTPVVQQVVQEVVPVNVAFVPAQVLLNAQVTSYGPASTVSYQPQPDTQVDPTPVVQSLESKAIEARISRLEAMMEKLLQAQGLVVDPPVK